MPVIAIDGVAGSGKSTLARSLARALELPYLDTGAMYRAVALACVQLNVDWNDEHAVTELCALLKIEVGDTPVSVEINGEVRELTPVRLNDEDVSAEIRGSAASQGASAVAVHPGVRAELIRRQQEWIAERGSCVVEGRDIGSVVCPNAEVKIYLTADQHERAERRSAQNSELAHQVIDLEELKKQIAWRDENDTTRGGLSQVEEAVVIDTTDLQPEETFQIALALVRERI